MISKVTVSGDNSSKSFPSWTMSGDGIIIRPGKALFYNADCL